MSRKVRVARRWLDVETRNAEMTALRAKGETLEEIGQRYGLSRERVRQITTVHVSAADAEAAFRGWRMDDLTTDRLWALLREHGTIADVTKALGVAHGTLRVLWSSEMRRVSRAEQGRRIGQAQRTKHGTDERADEARRLREQGLTYDAIAVRLGTAAQHARRLALMGGPDPLGRVMVGHTRPRDRMREAARLRSEGLTGRKIAETLGYASPASALQAAAGGART